MTRPLPLATLALLAGCGGAASMSLSARAGAPAASTTSRSRTSAGTALTLSNGIVLSRVRIVISELKLEGAATADAGTAGDGAASDEDEVEAGPFLLDLSGPTLDGGTVQKILDAPLKPGTYAEVKFKIHRPGESEDGVAPNAALKAMADAGASIIVDGTIDGAAFSFVTPLEVEQKFDRPLVLGPGSNLTINVDETGWFGSATARLDPRVAANQAQIEANIQASFRAFRDDQRDGHED